MQIVTPPYEKMIQYGTGRLALRNQNLCFSQLLKLPSFRPRPPQRMFRKTHHRSFSYLWDVIQSGNVFASNPILKLIPERTNYNSVQRYSKPTPVDLSSMTASNLTRAASQVQKEYEEAWRILMPKLNDLGPEELLENLDQLESASLVVDNVASLCHHMHVFNDSWIRAVHQVGTDFEHEQSRELYLALLESYTKVDVGTETGRLLRKHLNQFELRGVHLDTEVREMFLNLEASKIEFESKFIIPEEVNEQDSTSSTTKEQLQSIYGMLAIRQKQAELLGYDTYVDLALDGRTISDANEIHCLHNEVAKRASLALESVENESKKIDLTSHLSLDGTLQGLFAIARALFGVVISEDENPNGWNQDVRLFHITAGDVEERWIGSFYIDAYKRSTKTRSTLMAPLTPRIVYMNINAKAPVWDDSPSPVCLEDVVAIFHEFGHVLQFILARDNSWYRPDSSSIDISEVMPQFMEHWVFEESMLQTLAHISGSATPIPDEVVTAIQKQRRNEKIEESLRRVFLGKLELDMFSRKDNEESLVALQRRLVEDYVPHEPIPKSDLSPMVQLMEANGRLQRPVAQYRYLMSELISADLFLTCKEMGISNQDKMKKLGHSLQTLILEPGTQADIKKALLSICEHESVSADAYFKLNFLLSSRHSRHHGNMIQPSTKFLGNIIRNWRLFKFDRVLWSIL
mmetsp:Transcript_17578/g.26684  ORF Transcript_17578/g.26684 Transcript_17578/m.26684 type:complete len:688 (+) Transcript_17578:224-2287(+)